MVKVKEAGIRRFGCIALLLGGVISTALCTGPATAVAFSYGREPPEQKGEKNKRKKLRHRNKKKGNKDKMSALNFVMKDIDGQNRDLRDYYGKVVLIVNVASRCGLTSQYEGLQALYKKHKDEGLVILAFPANNFGAQEPGTNVQIKDFCANRYSVTFPLFSKVSVKDDEICPLYQYLTDKDAGHDFGGEIEWNFAKFLINRNGELVNRFHPRITPTDERLLNAIEKALKDPVPEKTTSKKTLKRSKTISRKKQ